LVFSDRQIHIVGSGESSDVFLIGKKARGHGRVE
jgi:hypothetical protein